MSSQLKPTDLIHGDAHIATRGDRAEVAPSISVSTSAFRQSDGRSLFAVACFIITDSPHLPIAFRASLNAEDEMFDPVNFRDPTRHVYSRYTQDVSTRAEHVLSKINVKSYRLLYPCL